MEDVYLLDGVRSPMGKYGGGLAALRATEIAAPVADEVLRRADIAGSRVSQLIGGMVLQDMTESNAARVVGQRIGLPDAVPAFTLNMQCASGMSALILAARQVAMGAADCVLTVGMESMSNPPYMVQGARWGLRLGHTQFTDSLQECKLAGSAMWDDPWTMIDVAEHHAEVDGVTRAEMDEYALVSHQRAIDAIDEGRYDSEILPITVPAKNAPQCLEKDENPRRTTSLESLANLKPVRPGGTVTAGNASPHTDGAAAALVCSGRFLAECDSEPLAKLPMQGMAMMGCDPQLMGYSCVQAAQYALEGAQHTMDSIDLIECNEGFAVQMVACERMGKWPRERVNVDGGSVALGHPVGMSGLRVVIHLAKALQQRDLRHGLATVPAGSGLGTAVVLERI